GISGTISEVARQDHDTAPSSIGPQASAMGEPPQKRLKGAEFDKLLAYWKEHSLVIRSSLRAAAKAEHNSAPQGPCERTLFERGVKNHWEPLEPHVQEQWMQGWLKGGPPPGQTTIYDYRESEAVGTSTKEDVPMQAGEGEYASYQWCQQCWEAWSEQKPDPKEKAMGCSRRSRQLPVIPGCGKCGVVGVTLFTYQGPSGFEAMRGVCWLTVCAPRTPQIPAPVAEGPSGAASSHPLFPEFERLGGGSGGGGGPGPQQGNGDAKRYDRWIRLLPTGAVPSDRVVPYWAMTWPAGNPVFTLTSTWPHILQSGQPRGVLIKFGKQKG
ncbi:unnamed protein product, partial [Prorocentrum cordatum]